VRRVSAARVIFEINTCPLFTLVTYEVILNRLNLGLLITVRALMSPNTRIPQCSSPHCQLRAFLRLEARANGILQTLLLYTVLGGCILRSTVLQVQVQHSPRHQKVSHKILPCLAEVRTSLSRGVFKFVGHRNGGAKNLCHSTCEVRARDFSPSARLQTSRACCLLSRP
jgi:hypothetical protein